MGDNKRKCWKCGAISGDATVVLYRFPKPGVKNILRCELWAKYMFPNGSWASTKFQNKLYSEHRMLCHKHFNKTSFIDFDQKKLHRHAAPDVKCDKIAVVETDYSSTPGPPHAILKDITNTRFHESHVAQLVQDTKTDNPIPSPSHASYAPPTEKTNRKLSGLNKPLENICNKDSKTETLQSGKDRHYYLKCRKYLKKICQLRNTLKKIKTKHNLHILNEDDAVRNLEAKISPTFALLLQSQIKNFKRKPRGRRWSIEDKMIALRLYKRSPACYRILRRLFCLPAPSSLKQLLSQFNMPPGINEQVMKSLKKYAEAQKPSDKEFVLMFDEISLKKHLEYNKKSDHVVGYQDHGKHGRTQQEALKALVFMVAGIRKPVKQPVAYYLSGANVTGDRLTVLIKENLCECFKAGLQVSATVCDMGGTNRKALAALGATEKYPLMKIDGRDVIALYDTPHLLKCFRNMFMKYDIKCKTDISSGDKCGEGIAKWSHIKQFYEMDSSNMNFVYAPSLKKEHLDPNTKQKMKVNLAAQVLSHTVACGMFSKVSEGKLPGEAVVTANIISKLDKLFDLVNSDSPDRRRGKPHATNLSSSSPHLKCFQEMKTFFNEINFIGCPRLPPSIEGWIWTLNGIEMLWSRLKKYPDVKTVSTRRLQQDPIENLFGCIRANCGSNTNPTSSAFIGGLKTAIMSNLAHISSGNCEDDSNLAIIENFRTLLSPSSHICTEEECFQQLGLLFQSSINTNNIIDTISEDSGEMQACAYVCGFLIRNHNKIYQCAQCKQIFEAKEADYLHGFVQNKEYNEYKQNLKYASKTLIDCVENSAVITNAMLTEHASKRNLKQIIGYAINDHVFNFLKRCPLHFKENKMYIKNSLFYICINRFCTLRNRSFAEEASQSALKKKIDILQHR